MPRVPEDLRAGVRATLPLWLGLIPFGLVAGIAAVDAGLTPAQAVGLSAIVFAGSAQLAALDLLASDASLAVVVLTATVINLRMSMYSASIAPHFAAFRRRWRAFGAFLLTDMSYALAIAEFADREEPRSSGNTSEEPRSSGSRPQADDGPAETPNGDARAGDDTADDSPSGTDTVGSTRRWRYYFGAAITMWAVWIVTTAGGVVVGTSVPEGWGVDFAVPLVFLALLVPELTDRPQWLAALVGGSVAVAGAGWPLNLGLVGGALAGVAAGVVAERRIA